MVVNAEQTGWFVWNMVTFDLRIPGTSGTEADGLEGRA